MKRILMVLASAPLFLGLAAWGSLRLFRMTTSASAAPAVPSTSIKRGDVIVTITAKGELQGGNSEMLFAPMAGGGALVITSLRESGEVVKAGEVVATFDTTEQEFKLREAQADLAEAEQQLIQAQAESRAKAEEARYALMQARADVRIAELECRRNEILAKIPAKENELALAAARDKVRQLEHDLADRLATAQAGIAIQEAAGAKARVAADTARRNIELMTLRAKAGGYVARQQNMDGNFRWGSYIPTLQVGDTVRAGVAVAQIPDLRNWEATARIGELDRGHLAEGQKAEAAVIALPGLKFKAHIKSIGGTTGPPWDRHFDCRIAIDDPSPDLRPGMSARIVITTDVLRDVLWAPSQAVFESDGRKYIYARSDAGFSPRDVKLVRRSESQAVLSGVSEGQVVALANPDEIMKRQTARTGALQALQR
jgi:multidrug efflux pump subunit AcrA (membrane-fusion protein)